MNSIRAKNTVIIILVSIIVLSIVGGAIFVALGNKDVGEGREFFFDEAPVNYNSDKNAVYARLFSKAVAEYLQPISSQLDFSPFANQLLTAMSLSRIPAEKLGGMAQVIDEYSVTSILAGIDIEMLDTFTEEDLENLMQVDTLKEVSEFLDGFFRESGLTGEETGLFLYNYMNTYGSEGYKASLSVMGKDTFVELISSTTYFLTSVSDVKNGTGDYVNSAVLKSALYELGSALIDAGRHGAGVLEEVLGLKWQYGETKTHYAEINNYLGGVENRLGYIFPLIGYVLKEISSADIEYARLYSEEKSDYYLLSSQSGFSRSVRAGVEKFLVAHGEDFGGDSIDTLNAELKTLFLNLHKAKFITAGADPTWLTNEYYTGYFRSVEENFDGFFSAVKNLSLMPSYEELTAEKIAIMKEEVQKLWLIEDETASVVSSVFYMWTAQRLHNFDQSLNTEEKE